MALFRTFQSPAGAGSYGIRISISLFSKEASSGFHDGRILISSMPVRNIVSLFADLKRGPGENYKSKFSIPDDSRHVACLWMRT